MPKILEKRATRDGFGEGLLLAGKKYKNVVALSADLTESTRASLFAQRFPERFFEVGVAEQNLVTIASGLAHEGKIPFATSYAVFSPGRNWEQIRTTICYNNVPVVIVGGHAGLTVGEDGATHQALEDIALMRVLPNMQVIYPCDALEAKKATLALAKTKQPAYLRLSREKSSVLTKESDSFEIGKARIMRKGNDVTLVSTGPILGVVLHAAFKLGKKGISAEVIHFATIKPMDAKALTTSVKKTGAVVSVEEHQIAGGFGSVISETLSQSTPVPQEYIGVHDQFGESGTADGLLEKYNISAEAIVRASQKVMKRKK
jgi:transketolase